MTGLFEKSISGARAVCKLADLRQALGLERYRLWYELTWPGKRIYPVSHAEAYEIADKALENVDHLQLTCNCNGANKDSCPICQAQARIAERWG